MAPIASTSIFKSGVGPNVASVEIFRLGWFVFNPCCGIVIWAFDVERNTLTGFSAAVSMGTVNFNFLDERDHDALALI